MKIEILDSIECQVSKEDGKILFPLLSYEAIFWKQGPYRKTRHTYRKSAFSFQGKTHWCFYTGLLPRVRKWTEEQGIPLEVVGEEIKIIPQAEPFLKGPGFKEFREDQLKLIDAACAMGRGIVQAPTGVGKTLVFLGIISCYPKLKILILAHSTSIVDQVYKELQRFGFKSIEMFGSGNAIATPTKQIVISTMQSFIKIPTEQYMDYFDCVLLDEAHHLQMNDSTYATILSNMLAPIRLGFTATVRTNDEAQLISEGLLGPVIGKMTIEEAAELKILARPKLRFIKSKCNQAITELRKYQDVYAFGIINNQARNQQIAQVAKEFYDKNETTLIFVTQIEHGNLIAEEIKKILGVIVPFVQGNMPQEERTKIKNALIKKKIKIVLATTSWSEGVNIQNLNSVIITSGGKSEIQTLQRVGRGLRKTEGKDIVTIVDFLDISHYLLTRQVAERLAIYSDMGWL